MDVTWRRLELTYRHEFRIARGGSNTTTSLLVEIAQDGLVGRGEGVPVRYYGWTLDRMEAAVAAMAAGLEPSALTRVDSVAADLLTAHGDQPSAVAAVEGALWDLAAQRLGVPLATMLGIDTRSLGLTSFTIGLADREVMLAKADEAAEYPILKVKCGGADDLAKVRALREATGKRLWVDANGGWEVAQAADLSAELATLGVELIEQPVPREDLAGLAAVRAVSPLPIVADESCHGAADVIRLKDVVDGVNLKLDKVGGLAAARRAIHTARACGLKLMLGCFGASSVALTLAGQLAPLVDWCDLDGHLLVADDPFVGLIAPNGQMALPAGPGLGLQPRGTL